MTPDDTSPRVPRSPRLTSVVCGAEDTRLRASLRVLLSWGLLFAWSVIAARAGALSKPLWSSFPAPARQILNITVGTVIFLVLFALFARYIDRRRLADYGFARTPKWVGELAVGFLAVLIGTALWHALCIALGWTTIDLALAPSNLTGGLWLVALLLPWYFSGLTQSLLSVALVTKNSAEGLHARGAPLAAAAAGGVVVATLFFTLRHSPTTAPRVLSLVFGGAVFTLLYVHSGHLALSIGALGSANYTNRFIFANSTSGGPAGDGLHLFQLSQSLPEVVGVIAQTNLPALSVTYLLAVSWLAWQRDGVAIHPSLTRWRPLLDTS